MWWLVAAVVLVFGLVAFRGAPYVPTHTRQTKLALDLLDLEPGEVFVDLGSGDGVMLKIAAQRELRVHGFELNPLLCLVSYLRCWRYRDQVTIHWRDFWLSKLPDDTTAVFVFLASPFMARLAAKLQTFADEHNRPLLLVSYGFALPGHRAVKSQAGLHLYRLEPIKT